MFSKWRKLAKHLEQHGRRAPATVVEIAKHGSEVRSEGIGISHLMPGSAGDSLLPRNSGGYMVRRAKLAVRPANEPGFEVERKIRFGDWGRYVPKSGEEIEVVYDPNDHEKLLVAPPTAEEEQARTIAALSKADIGFTVGGGGGAKGSGEPVSDEQMAQHQQSMDQAQQMLDQAQQFMSGGLPGQSPPEKKDEKRPEDE